MNIVSHTLFAENYVAEPARGNSAAGASVLPDEIQVLASQDIEKDLRTWEQRQYERLGSVEFVAKGSHGVGREARAQAKLVGANLVLFRLWPAKLKAVRRKSNGSIDIDSVVADPPAGLSSRGYYVLRAIFLRSRD